MNLDLDCLRSFVAVAELSSFTQAAERVSRTQSAVSMQIRNLEDRLGFSLFERTKRSVRLTADGQRVLEKARNILQVHDDSVRDLTAPQLEGRLNLGITEYFVPEHLPQLILRFMQQYPSLQVEVTTGVTGPLRDMQKDGKIDVVIGRRDVGTSGGLVLRREKLRWVAAKTFDWMPRQPIPLALLPPGCGVRAQALAALDRAHKPWRSVYCGPSVWGLQAMISSGLAVGCLTQSALRDDFRVLGSAQGLPNLTDSEIVLYGASAKASPQIKQLSDIVRDYFGALQ
jgi:DNA-binding transcriptional LysR family regulator